MKIKKFKTLAQKLIEDVSYRDEFVIPNKDYSEEPWITENAFMCLIYLSQNEGKRALSLYRKLNSNYQDGLLYKHKPSSQSISIPGSISMGFPALALGHENKAREIYYEIKNVFNRNKNLKEYLFDIAGIAMLHYAIENEKPYYIYDKRKEFKTSSVLYRDIESEKQTRVYSNALTAILLNLLDDKEVFELAETLLNTKTQDIRDKILLAFMCLSLSKEEFGKLKFF